MIFNYFNWIHIVILLIFAGAAAGCYFLLKNKSDKTKKIFIFVLMVINFIQHVFKMYIWPCNYGEGFTILETAYNMCALLMIIEPFIFISKSRAFNETINLVGLIAGAGAAILPYFFVGKDILNFNFLRYMVCHFLLFVSNFLYFIFDFNDLKIKNFYKTGLWVFVLMFLIIANCQIFYLLKGYNWNDAWYMTNYGPCNNALSILRPTLTGSMAPLYQFIKKLSPAFLTGDEKGVGAIPILWYALPVYVLVTFVTFIIELCFQLVKNRREKKHDCIR